MSVFECLHVCPQTSCSSALLIFTRCRSLSPHRTTRPRRLGALDSARQYQQISEMQAACLCVSSDSGTRTQRCYELRVWRDGSELHYGGFKSLSVSLIHTELLSDLVSSVWYQSRLSVTFIVMCNSSRPHS